MRWFANQAPASGVEIRNLSDIWMGFAVSGPQSRAVLARLTGADVSTAALPFMACREMSVGLSQAIVGRLAITGELGYEINVPAAELLPLYQALHRAGGEPGLVDIGGRALDALRLEKGWGAWGAEYAQSYTPGMCGLDRHIDFDKPDFIGRDAALKERDAPSRQRLVLLVIETEDVDARGYEPVWHGTDRVGFITSGGFGHHVRQSLALAYVDREIAVDGADLEVSLIGTRRPAIVSCQPAYDPSGQRMRA